ncbi:unnamed protein product, partial [Didymodactylos carnosus]
MGHPLVVRPPPATRSLRRLPRRQRIIVQHQQEKEKKKGRWRYWGKVTKILSAILVPTMIAAFTIVTTIQQRRISEANREKDIQIADYQLKQATQLNEQNRLKDMEIANIKVTLERQIAEENREKDLQIANITGHIDFKLKKLNRKRLHFSRFRGALERQIAEQNREKDIQIANIKAALERQIAHDNREKDIQIAHIKAALERQIAYDNREKDLQLADDIEKSTIFNSYLQDISNLLLKNGLIIYDLGSLVMARAKTLMILRQIDSKRKRYLIQFLYESSIIVSSALADYQQILSSSYAPNECQLPPIVPNEMVNVGETMISSNQTLDMHGADLSNLAFHSHSKQMLSGIKLAGADFLNASFIRITLK